MTSGVQVFSEKMVPILSIWTVIPEQIAKTQVLDQVWLGVKMSKYLAQR